MKSPDQLSTQAHSAASAAREIGKRTNSLATVETPTERKIGILEAYGTKSRKPASTVRQFNTLTSPREKSVVLEKSLPEV